MTLSQSHSFTKPTKAIIIILVGLMAGTLYPILSGEISDPFAMVNGIIIGLLGSTLIAAVELYGPTSHDRNTGFLSRVVGKSVLYTVCLVFLILIVLVLSRSLQYDLEVIDYVRSDAFYSLVFEEDFFIIMLYTLFLSTCVIFTNQISRKMGQGVLWNFITGKYHHPKEEERIFMFLDLKGSTQLAEQLGGIRFSNYINDFFYDITPAILEAKGEIYRYVGDEIVVSWDIKRGLRDANCVRAFFLARHALRKHREKYLKRYGTIPAFRAGYHCGKVVVGEIGKIKSQISFSGEVMYLASQIEQECKTFRRENLISIDLLKKISLPGIYEMKPVSNVTQKSGRQIDLYTIKEIEFEQPF